jgi:DNA-binding transcriptional MerR regulator
MASKAMEKNPEAFRTIREVAEAMDLPQHVLRFWETRFPQIRPLKRAGGRRYYRPDDVERLKLIRRLLYDDGYTIKGVQKLFKQQRAQNAATAVFDAQLPFGPGDSFAPGDHEEDFSRIAPAPTVESEPPPARVAWAEPSAPAPRLSADDIAALRGVLAEIREAQRILGQARPQPA